ncbi:helix-turn-helix domain-containing protein [Trinickia symbiotica]|nr:LysR family transcriptional regulator [Trinickia symbiotica]
MGGSTRPPPLNWNSLRTFLAIAQHRSLADAARAAGVQRPTMSQKIASLEGQLGVRLMERRAGSDGFRLTPHGKRLRRLLLDFNRQLAILSRTEAEPSCGDKLADMLEDVDEALSALGRVSKALRRP